MSSVQSSSKCHKIHHHLSHNMSESIGIPPSAPDGENIHTSLVADTLTRNNSNLSSENKYKVSITSERLAELKKIVEDAIKDHRVFIIRGGWQTLRKALLKRNWIEKYEPSKLQKPVSAPITGSIDDLCSNLPSRQMWESPSAHINKCEKMIISRLLQLYDVDFYWNMRRDQADVHYRMTNKIINRFSRSLFTSKEGLCLLLQQMYWHNEPGVANVNFPRCYVLGFPDHYNYFVDDFRLTACISLLKYTIHKYETEDEYAIQSPEGQVPMSSIQFAMDRCNEFVASRKHLDIDIEINRINDEEWNQFLFHFNQIVHQNYFFLETKEYSINVLSAASKGILLDLEPHLAQINLDGMKNIWIMKPGNKCRGRGIQLIKNVQDVTKIVELKMKYVVQKYIERPLIIYQTKFDIRQWFLITSAQPLIIWMYRECYLRFSSQNFNLENFHESLHLTNHAVQCKYKNTDDRDEKLPDNNMWDVAMFREYLTAIGHETAYDEIIYPGMKQSIIGSMLACQETMDRRPNTFEIYGADFMIDEHFKPWLLEINSSPDLSPSTSITSRMCPQVLEDLIRVVIDKRKDLNAETGSFDLVYKQNLPRAPAYLGMSLSVRGRKIFRKKSTKQNKDKENENVSKQLVKATSKEDNGILTNKEIANKSPMNEYTGPVIADLMEEIQKTYYDSDNGVGFVPAVKVTKKKAAKDRVPKSETCRLDKIKTNKNNPPSIKLKERENVKTLQERNKAKTNYLDMFNEWNIKQQNCKNEQKDAVVSILKGKNIMGRFHFNKDALQKTNIVSNIDLNALLPDIVRLNDYKTRKIACVERLKYWHHFG